MVTLSVGDVLMVVGLLLTVSGMIFVLWKLFARVESIEAWRAAMPAELDKIHGAIRDLRSEVLGHPHGHR